MTHTIYDGTGFICINQTDEAPTCQADQFLTFDQTQIFGISLPIGVSGITRKGCSCRAGWTKVSLGVCLLGDCTSKATGGSITGQVFMQACKKN
ncbi:MAG: hypothetical protein EB059_05305 [Alphaproteobacteria bacterium]|nr:hypothetical protein [Alphaproteobacteria bacterium]